jgi:type I restriction enzyme S subunit
MNENTDKKGQSVLLGNILSERTEKPSLEDIYSGKIRIISKIRFDTGQIELRNNSNTKTGMILIFPGDLVLSGINACKGAIAVYDEDNTEAIAATIHYSSYKPYKNKVDIKFLWLLLRSEVFRDILNQYLPGGIKTELKAKKFLKIPIPLPPLSEQQRIVSKLTVLSSKIEEAKKLNEKALIETDSIIDSTLDRIIKNGGKNGWNFVPFDNVCEINPSKRGINYADDLLVSFIPMTAVDDHTGTIINHIIKPYYEVKNGYKWFVEGDVIFARITPCMENGKSAIARNLKNGVGFGST